MITNNIADPITISALGSCITRDTFRICDSAQRFHRVKNVGFISPISMCAKIDEPIEELEKSIQKSNISNFEKRNILLDLEGQAFTYLKSEKAEYLILDLIEMRLPILKKDNNMVTIRGQSMEATLTRKFLTSKGGYHLIWSQDFAIDEVRSYLDIFCENIRSNWDSDKIILIGSQGARCIRGENGHIENNELFEKSYDKYFLKKTGFFKKINDYVAQKLKCHYIQMPPMNYVMAEIGRASCRERV